MINLSANAVMVLRADGSQEAFDPDGLQVRLAKACLAAGRRDFWLAEDIANAIENALFFHRDQGTLVSDAEISFWATRVREEAGSPDVAECFREGNQVDDDSVPAMPEQAAKVLAGRLGLDAGELERLARRTCDALGKLGLAKASRSLVLELARQLRLPAGAADADFKLPSVPNIANSPWLLSRQELLAALPAEAASLVERKVLDFRGVSRLFPSLIVDLRLGELAELSGLRPLVTELSLYPRFKRPAAAMAEIVRLAREMAARSQGGADLAVYLRFPDMRHFAVHFLGLAFPDGQRVCADVAAAFAGHLDFPVRLKV